MHLISIAIALGDRPLAVTGCTDTLVQSINTILPDWKICETTTGDEIRQKFDALAPERRQEILTIVLLDPVQSVIFAESVYHAHFDATQEEKNFGWFAAIVAILAFLLAFAIVGYVFGTDRVLDKPSVTLDSRRTIIPYNKAVVAMG